MTRLHHTTLYLIGQMVLMNDGLSVRYHDGSGVYHDFIGVFYLKRVLFINGLHQTNL